MEWLEIMFYATLGGAAMSIVAAAWALLYWR
jgi:hypothetical protein